LLVHNRRAAGRTGQIRLYVVAVAAAVEAVEAEVRELVRRRGLDPFADQLAMRRLVDEVVHDYDERSLTSSLPPLPDPRSAARAVYDSVAGFGPLQRHLDDPTVEEIWINEPGPGVRRQARPVRADDDHPERRPGPRPGGEDAEDDRAPGRPVHALRRRDAARRLAPARRHPRHHPAALVGQHPQVRAVGQLPRRAGRPRDADAAGGRFLEASIVAGLNIIVAGAPRRARPRC
jgi:hypothetical protein